MGTGKGCSAKISTKPHCLWCCPAYQSSHGCWPGPNDWSTVSPGLYEKTGQQRAPWLGSYIQWPGVDQADVEANYSRFATNHWCPNGPLKDIWQFRQPAKQTAWLFDTASKATEGTWFWKHIADPNSIISGCMFGIILPCTVRPSWLKNRPRTPEGAGIRGHAGLSTYSLDDWTPTNKFSKRWRMKNQNSRPFHFSERVDSHPSLPSQISFHAVCSQDCAMDHLETQPWVSDPTHSSDWHCMSFWNDISGNQKITASGIWDQLGSTLSHVPKCLQFQKLKDHFDDFTS